MSKDDQFSEKEIARRRDEIVRRMANTPPQHKASPKLAKKATKKKASKSKKA